MQLKMTQSFNVNFARQLLLNENNFISDIFSKTPLPVSETVQSSKETNKKLQSRKVKTFSLAGKSPKRAQTYEELKGRLDSLKNVKKLDHRHKLLKKNLKNRIKKKDKREERLSQKLVKTAKHSGNLTKVKVENGEGPKVPKPKPVFNSEGKMVFSKFDFSEIGTKRKPPKTDKDPKKLLQQLQQKKEKLKELEKSGETDKAQEIKEKEAWKSALAKAGGEKVKNDPDLLKKTIKKQEQQKKASSKKWDARLDKVKKSIQEKQEKRRENIMKRKKDKKLNKMKKSAKKGRVIPGF